MSDSANQAIFTQLFDFFSVTSKVVMSCILLIKISMVTFVNLYKISGGASKYI